MTRLTYRYRPRAFGDFIGQDHVLDWFRVQVQSEAFGNGILHGPPGIGKTSGGRAYGRATLCKSVTADGSGCGQCIDCEAFDSRDGHGSYREVDCARHGRVESMEEEIERLRFVSAFSPRRVLVLDEAHQITPRAWDILLKPLEEQRSSATILLLTTALDQIPTSIISRCTVHEFRPVGFADALTYLKRICALEHITYETEGLALIASMANGSIRDLLKHLEQVSEHINCVTEADVRRIFSLDYVDILIGYLKAVLEGNLQQQISIIENWASVPRKKSDAIQSLLTYLFATEVLRLRRHDPLMASISATDRAWIVKHMAKRALALGSDLRQFWQSATDFWSPVTEVTEASLIVKIIKFDSVINIDRRIAIGITT